MPGIDRRPSGSGTSSSTSSTFTMASLPGLAAWYDASVSSSITGSPVTQWNDLTLNGFNLTASGGACPATGATQNGLNVLTFDGSTDNLRNLSISELGLTVGTWVAVIRQSSVAPTSNGRIWCLHAAGADDWDNNFSIGITRDGTNAGVDSYYNGTARGITAMTNDAFHVAVMERNGDSFACWVDGVAGGTNTSLGVNIFAFTRMCVGASLGTGTTANSFWKGDVAELVWYDAALTSGDRKRVEASLKTKWATP